jgi:hypothetical protein
MVLLDEKFDVSSVFHILIKPFRRSEVTLLGIRSTLLRTVSNRTGIASFSSLLLLALLIPSA